VKIETIHIPKDINVIAIPTYLLSFDLVKRDNDYMLIVFRQNPVVRTECPRHGCRISIDMIPTGGMRLYVMKHSDLAALALGREVNGKQLKVVLYDEALVYKLEAGETIPIGTLRMVEAPPYLAFERVSGSEFRLTDKRPDAAIVRYRHSLHSRVACAEIEVLYSELITYRVCSDCCTAQSEAVLVGLGKEGQKIRLRLSDATYREKLADVEKLFVVRNARLVETVETANVI
jgi:hypothetical protein